MAINLKIEEKWLAIFLVLAVAFANLVYVVGYGGNNGVQMGHSSGEIDVDGDGDGVLDMTLQDWIDAGGGPVGNLSCVFESSGSGASNLRTISCDDDYHVTGCSTYDGWGQPTNTRPFHNGCRCTSTENGCYRLYAICCKVE